MRAKEIVGKITLLLAEDQSGCQYPSQSEGYSIM